jgi:LysM repeat protein
VENQLKSIFKFFSFSRTLASNQSYWAILLTVAILPAGCSGGSGSASSGTSAAIHTATPIFSPSGGAYSSSQIVTIIDAFPQATIHYTTDGSTPTSSSAVYSGPIMVTSTETVNALATESGYTTSAIATAAYNFAALSTLATPAFSPAAGSYTSPLTVTISDTSPQTTIHYTTDGSTPTATSAVYSAPITVTSTETVNALATESGYTTSAIATAAYNFSAALSTLATPSIWVAGGTNSSQQTVTMTGTNSGETIYYTSDGSTPTASSAVYSGPIVVSVSETVKAIAEESGYTASSVATAPVTIVSTPWDIPTVAGQVSYTEEIPLNSTVLPGSGAVDVVSAGLVDNTGTVDAACTIQALLNNSTQTHNTIQYGNNAPYQDVIFFFRDGTYLLSNPTCLPLVKNYSDGTPAYGMVFIGESQSGVVFKLPASTTPSVHFTGDTTAGNLTVLNVSSTAGLYVNQHVQGTAMRSGATITAVGTNSITLSLSPGTTAVGTSLRALTPMIFTQSAEASGVQNGNEGYHNVLENFTIDTSATGNTGAIGISYLANNLGAIRNVTVLGTGASADQGTGIDVTRQNTGPALIENVAITGFNFGIDVANNTTGITLEHITFDGQLSGAIRNNNNLVAASALWVKSGGGSAAITNAALDGMIDIANSRFDQTGSSLIANSAGGAISIHNTNFAVAQTNLGGASSGVNGVMVAQTWTAGNNLYLPLTIDTPIVPYDPASQWSAPTSGMSAQWTEEVTTPIDATGYINTALQCSKSGTTSTLYLPHGIWYIASPIQIPSWVGRIIGMDSTIRVLPSASANFPAGTPMFEVVSSSSTSCPYAPTLVIERIAFDGSGITVAPYAVRVDAPLTGYAARNVVVRDISGISLTLNVSRVAGGGELFVDDITGDPISLDGTNYFFGRQFDSEANIYCSQPTTNCKPRLTNNLAPAWILGFKTEGPSNVVNSLGTTPPYAVTEIVGAFTNTAPSSTGTVPGTTCAQSGNVISSTASTSATYILAAGAALETSFIEDVIPVGSQTVATQSYPFYVYDAGTCIAGAGNSTTPYTTGVIQRTGISTSPAESGFIVPQLLVKP